MCQIHGFPDQLFLSQQQAWPEMEKNRSYSSKKLDYKYSQANISRIYMSEGKKHTHSKQKWCFQYFGNKRRQLLKLVGVPYSILTSAQIVILHKTWFPRHKLQPWNDLNGRFQKNILQPRILLLIFANGSEGALPDYKSTWQ